MSRSSLIGIVCLLGCLSNPALAVEARGSATIDLGGFFGRIDIGGLPPPVLVAPTPVIIAPQPHAVVRQPVYLRVPPGHAKHWAKHCHRYSACGQPVYFVQEGWYQSTYLPAHPGRGPMMAPPRQIRYHGHGVERVAHPHAQPGGHGPRHGERNAQRSGKHHGGGHGKGHRHD